MTLAPSGIYKITNLSNGKIYIGQSQNMFIRRTEHWTALRRNAHPNKEMQKDWNKNNRSWRFDVVEYCSIDKLNEREKYWIEKLNTIEKGYNQGWVPYKRKNKKALKKIKGYHKTR